MDYNRLLHLAMDVGMELLENGAETYRVEETMRRLALAYGVAEAGVFVVPTGIIASLTAPSGVSVARTRRIFSRRVDLDRIDRLNALCRSVCETPVPLEELAERLRTIQASKRYTAAVRAAGGALIGFGCTLFFGGVLQDALCGTVIGGAVQVVAGFLDRLRLNGIFVNIVGGGLIMLLALLSVQLGWGVNVDKMVIGSLMGLVPGVSLTNSMRDLISGDYMAGQARLAEAILTATAIALGAGAVLSVVNG